MGAFCRPTNVRVQECALRLDKSLFVHHSDAIAKQNVKSNDDIVTDPACALTNDRSQS